MTLESDNINETECAFNGVVKKKKRSFYSEKREPKAPSCFNKHTDKRPHTL